MEKITSLSFKFSGTMIPSYSEYSAFVEDNCYKIFHRKTLWGTGVIEWTLCSSHTVIEKFESVINKYNINSWRGWNEHAEVTDSYNFNFCLEYEGCETIEAHGHEFSRACFNINASNVSNIENYNLDFYKNLYFII